MNKEKILELLGNVIHLNTAELSALPEFDADFFGFDVSALNPNPAQEYDEEADVIPEPPAEPKARRGGYINSGTIILCAGTAQARKIGKS